MKIPKFKSNPLFSVLSEISLKNKIVTFYLGRSIPKHVINMYIFLATSVPKCRFSLQYFYLPKLCTTCFVPTIYVHIHCAEHKVYKTKFNFSSKNETLKKKPCMFYMSVLWVYYTTRNTNLLHAKQCTF